MAETKNDAARSERSAHTSGKSFSTRLIDRIRNFVSRGTKRVAPPDFTDTYSNPVHRFSFKHPASLRIEHTDRGGTTTIVARNRKRTIGFQLHIRPFGGEPHITPAALARDLPGVKTRGHERVRISAIMQTWKFT